MKIIKFDEFYSLLADETRETQEKVIKELTGKKSPSLMHNIKRESEIAFFNYVLDLACAINSEEGDIRIQIPTYCRYINKME